MHDEIGFVSLPTVKFDCQGKLSSMVVDMTFPPKGWRFDLHPTIIVLRKKKRRSLVTLNFEGF